MKMIRAFYLLTLALTFILPIGCDAGNDQSNQVTTNSANDKNITAYIEHAKNIVKNNELTDIPIKCLKFVNVEDSQEFKAIIDVREVHNKTCGGDSQTSPRLFTIAFTKDNHIWSDAKSLLGQLEPLD
jgi:hypothetical protein